MHITLDNENKDKVLQASQKLGKSCTWIINQIIKAVELGKMELREELHIVINNENQNTESTQNVRKSCKTGL